MTPHEEALRRIVDAKARNADLLDLGDLRLEDVPKELGELTQLRMLSLGNMLLMSFGGNLRTGGPGEPSAMWSRCRI